MTMSYQPLLVLAAEGDVVQHNKLLKYFFVLQNVSIRAYITWKSVCY